MRRAFVEAVHQLMGLNDKVVLILCDISVHAFRETFDKFPNRCFNLGILEPSAVLIAAGFAKEGFIPIVHSIAPFLAERSLEMLKVAFGYQKLRGIFVSVGASYDYAHLGATHHCPADVEVLSSIPNMRIMVPAHGKDAARYVFAASQVEGSTYIRLAEDEADPSDMHFDSIFRQADTRNEGCIVTIGPTKRLAAEVLSGLVDWIHVDQVHPFPKLPRFRKPTLVIEPFYEGTLARYFVGQPVEFLGVARNFITSYGTRDDMHDLNGLTSDYVMKRYRETLSDHPR